MNPRLRTAAIAAAVVVIDRITKMYIRSAYTSWDVTPVIPRVLQHRAYRKSRRGLRDSRGFPQRVEQHAAGGGFAGGDGDHRRDAVAAPASRRCSRPGWFRWDWRWYSAAHSAIVWDRLFAGTVTDFLQVFFGSYEFPSFNAADSAITVGAALLLIDLWRTRHQHHTEHGELSAPALTGGAKRERGDSPVPDAHFTEKVRAP